MAKKYTSKQIGCLELRTLRTDQTYNCIVEHPTTKTYNSKRQATHAIYIAGMPTGHLCKPCVKEWKQIWEEII